jgi:hypothetical protein
MATILGEGCGDIDRQGATVVHELDDGLSERLGEAAEVQSARGSDHSDVPGAVYTERAGSEERSWLSVVQVRARISSR